MKEERQRTVSIVSYYTCLGNMEKKSEKFGRKHPVKTDTEEAYQKWKEESRKILWELLGMDKMEFCPLQSRVTERAQAEDGILREHVLIQVEPDVWMPVEILIPQVSSEKNNRLSCVIAPPGHQGAGKYTVAGHYEIPAVNDMIQYYHYDYGMQLARRGFVALCPDCRGFGERRERNLWGEEEEKFLNSSCFHLAHMAEPLGMTVAGMLTWDLMRLVDYIEERNEWNLSDIGCLGFSGGGMQTLWLAAMDERIARACISGYMYGYRDSLLKLNGNCSCNYVPHLWEYFDMGDIGAMIAPRPLLIQSGSGDHLNGEHGIANVREQVEIIRSAYRCLKKEEHLHHTVHSGGHQWHEEDIAIFETM